MVLKQNEIGWRQIAGENDHRLEFLVRNFVAQLLVTEQIANNPVDDIIDIITASAQVGIVHFIEHRHQCVAL